MNSRMQAVDLGHVTLHVQESGDPAGVPLVFSNSLGTDLRLWDAVLPHLPDHVRIIRYDTRGHGLSGCPAAPYTIDDLTTDTAGLLDALGVTRAIFVGLSLGGMIGQNLARLRPDLIRALVLSNTAARMGDPAIWAERIAAIRAQGLATIADGVLDRWFGPAFRQTPAAALWGAMLSRTPQAGYLGCCAAIAGADLTAGTATLRLPVLAIAGDMDRASPPDLVAATAAMIPGATCHVMARVGHLPCVENPAGYAAILSPFIKEHANV